MEMIVYGIGGNPATLVVAASRWTLTWTGTAHVLVDAKALLVVFALHFGQTTGAASGRSRPPTTQRPLKWRSGPPVFFDANVS